MPFINVKTNAKLTSPQKEIIKRRLFDCIGIIPGKSDRYLMVAIDDGADMAFHRDAASRMAMVEVKLSGESTKDAYQRLTGAICMILSDEARVLSENCFVKFEEVKYWGHNGFMI